MQLFEAPGTELALLTRPNWLVMALGALLVVLGAVVIFVPAKATVLTLSRHNGFGAGEVHVKTLLRDMRVVRIPLTWMEGAIVTPGLIGKHPSFYHLDLDVRDGLGGLYFAWYGSRASADADAQRINAFMKDPTQQQVVVSNDKRPFYFSIGGTLAFIGLTLLLWSSLVVRATFDRPRRHVTVLRRGLLGTHVDVVPFAEIRDFGVAGISGDCQLFMQLASGRKVTLSSSTDMQNMVGPRRIRAIRLGEADRLRAFCAASELGL